MSSIDPDNSLPKCPFEAIVTCELSEKAQSGLSLSKGDIITVEKFEKDGWVFVRDRSGKKGFVSRYFIRPCVENVSELESSSTKTLIDPEGNLPDCPYEAVVTYELSVNAQSGLSLSKGDIITVEGYERDGWVFVRDRNGKKGFVSRHFIGPRVENV